VKFTKKKKPECEFSLKQNIPYKKFIPGTRVEVNKIKAYSLKK